MQKIKEEHFLKKSISAINKLLHFIPQPPFKAASRRRRLDLINIGCICVHASRQTLTRDCFGKLK